MIGMVAHCNICTLRVVDNLELCVVAGVLDACIVHRGVDADADAVAGEQFPETKIL